MGGSDRSSSSAAASERASRLSSPRSACSSPAGLRAAGPYLGSGPGLLLLALVLLASWVGAAEGEPDVPAAAAALRQSSASKLPSKTCPVPPTSPSSGTTRSGALPEGLAALAAEVRAIFRGLGVEALEGRGNVRQRRNAGSAR